MQAIHNFAYGVKSDFGLFQRAKVQDKCKQFTTCRLVVKRLKVLFQRAKVQDKCKQFTT